MIGVAQMEETSPETLFSFIVLSALSVSLLFLACQGLEIRLAHANQPTYTIKTTQTKQSMQKKISRVLRFVMCFSTNKGPMLRAGVQIRTDSLDPRAMGFFSSLDPNNDSDREYRILDIGVLFAR